MFKDLQKTYDYLPIQAGEDYRELAIGKRDVAVRYIFYLSVNERIAKVTRDVALYEYLDWSPEQVTLHNLLIVEELCIKMRKFLEK